MPARAWSASRAGLDVSSLGYNSGMTTQGILFIATGERYVRAAARSARSALAHCPGLPIHLYTDPTSFDSFLGEAGFPFTSAGKIENPHARSKVDYMSKTPYERTLFLDADTVVNSDIREMFQILDRFDIAMTHAHHRSPSNLKPWRIPLPDAFPEFNSGVVLFRKTPAVVQFWEGLSSHFGTDWPEAGRRTGQPHHDQILIRELLWLSDLRIATLPPEFNVRKLKYHLLWSRSEATTKIFHLKQFHMGWSHWLFRKAIHPIKFLLHVVGLDGFVASVRKIRRAKG